MMKIDTAKKRHIKAAMRLELEASPGDYFDCGEVNTTLLAETIALYQDLYGPAPDFDIPVEVFDAAHEVAEEVSDGELH